MPERLHTGIDVLDRKLDGGLPPGSIVLFTADPASQSELLLYELTAARGTLYLSTERSTSAIRDALDASPSTVGSPTIRHVDPAESVDDASRLIEALPDGANLIVDTVDALELTDRRPYLEFLNALKSRMVETGSIAILHGLEGVDIPKNRTRTTHVADAVFSLRTVEAGSQLENHLAIPKFRAGGQPTDRIKLELTESVTIDTSRDIA